jgi:hypothetical protein
MSQDNQPSVLLVEDEENLHETLKMNLGAGRLPGHFSF